MKASSLFKQYVWLVDTIRRARRITLSELGDRWLQTDLSEGVPLSRTTFNRHRAAVEEIFGVTIGCDADNRYYIVDSDLLRSDTVQQWMLNTLTTSNIISEARGLHDRILLESIPSEGEHLRQVVESMRRSVRISVVYQRYGTIEREPCEANGVLLREWTVEPYCIKLFRRRWYLLARFPDKGFVMLSFDRIKSLSLTEESFVLDANFDAQTWFSDYFGVMVAGNTAVERIVLRAYGNERFALRDLPLHHSQRELETGEDYVDFELRLHPTSDFLAQILSRGRWVKIISPEYIAQKIRNLHREAAE